MIDFKLAKELKDNGFPQNYKSGEIYFEDKSSKQIIDLINNHDSDDEVTISVPTISELIESCGEKFYSLTRLQPEEIKDKWGVESTESEDLYLGNSPEEAVAHLWLDINKVTKNKA